MKISIAERNRQIKRLLVKIFPSYKVRVFGSYSSHTGLSVTIKIDYAPTSDEVEREMVKYIKRIIIASGIEIGRWYDDYWDERLEMHVFFDRSRIPPRPWPDLVIHDEVSF